MDIVPATLSRVSLKLGNGLVIYGKTWQGKDKIALNKSRTFAPLDWQFFQHRVICRDHTLSLVESMCPSFQHPFHVYNRVQTVRVIKTTQPEDFLFSRVAFVIGRGNYSRNGWKVCTVCRRQVGDCEKKDCMPSTLMVDLFPVK